MALCHGMSAMLHPAMARHSTVGECLSHTNHGGHTTLLSSSAVLSHGTTSSCGT
jgi:hypothetical protein